MTIEKEAPRAGTQGAGSMKDVHHSTIEPASARGRTDTSPAAKMAKEAFEYGSIALAEGVELTPLARFFIAALGWKCLGIPRPNDGLRARELRISEKDLCNLIGEKHEKNLRQMQYRLRTQHCVDFRARSGRKGLHTVYYLYTLEQWKALMRFRGTFLTLWEISSQEKRHEIVEALTVDIETLKKKNGEIGVPNQIDVARHAEELDAILPADNKTVSFANLRALAGITKDSNGRIISTFDGSNDKAKSVLYAP